jgi:Tol biopolymer transport system component
VFVHDRRSGKTERVSVTTGGEEADGSSEAPAISSDGRYVAFVSTAANLAGFSDPGNLPRVYLRDREKGTSTRIPFPGETDPRAFAQILHFSPPAISGDGSTVAFSVLGIGPSRSAELEAIFLYDNRSGETVAVASDEPNAESQVFSLTHDGRRLAFFRYVDLPKAEVVLYDTQYRSFANVDFGDASAAYPVLAADGKEVLALIPHNGGTNLAIVAAP